MRYFEVINIDNKNAQTFIDGIRLIANPNIKHKAHITMKGPFESDKSILHERIRHEYQTINISGVENFFEFNQSTVFLRCFLKDRLTSLIEKRDYGNDNPHITLYNGDNKVFARKLYYTLKSEKISFQVIINELSIIHSKSEYEKFDDDFYNHLSYYLDKEINLENIQLLNEAERLQLIKKLILVYKEWNFKNVIASPCLKTINKLSFTEENGLFFYDNIDSWKNRFPYRITQALHQIKPYAFFALQDSNSENKLNYNLPFVFIFTNPSKEEEKEIKRSVFNFGNAPIVIIDYRTEVKIYNGLFFNGDYSNPNLELVGNNENINEFSFDNLVNYDFWDKHLQRKNGKKVYDSFLQNLSEIRDYLIFKAENKLSGAVCNRLIGRLLFIRYFIDRGVAFKINSFEKDFYFSNDVNKAREEFSILIKNKQKLYDFFNFFKEKYNGDLFPIYEEETELVNEHHLLILSELFRGGKFSKISEKLHLQKSLFDVYDFSIIPIELVSNVYERFMGKIKADENKAFYTPYFLADFVLEKTVGKYIDTVNNFNFSCAVLDPSCGSGIFLVEALRKIIEKKIQIKQKSLSNDELWTCVKENIYGIDIDFDAIDVAVFSIYITLLDYIEPKEISEEFKFKTLKESNFFPGSDFFDLSDKFNDVINNTELKYIIGNPPWGKVKKSPYMEYCLQRERVENSHIGISDYQIAQAFLIRVSDFFSVNTACSFVVTSKILYNANAQTWRQYFLENFSLQEVIDFSPVRTSIFDGASWPAAIISYKTKTNIPTTQTSIISVKNKEFFKRFNSFVIDKQSIKVLNEEQLSFLNSESHWFWKTMLYGSIFDFFILKRIKIEYNSIAEQIENLGLDYGVGLKKFDGKKDQDTSDFIGYKFINTLEKELHQFYYHSKKKWSEYYNKKRKTYTLNVGNIPSIKDSDNVPILFKAPLALIKEGLTPDIKGVAAFSKEDVVYTHSIRGIKGNEKDICFLKSIVTLINSNLFSYYILHTGSSVGIDLTRANQIEQLSFPMVKSEVLANFHDEILKIISSNEIIQDYSKESKKLNEHILDLYSFKKVERDFVEFTIKHVIPSLKHRVSKVIHKKTGVEPYLNVFKQYFIKHDLCFDITCYYDEKYIGIYFEHTEKKELKLSFSSDKLFLSKIAAYSSLSVDQLTKHVFLQKNITEYSLDLKSFFILKENDNMIWHPAIAWQDLAEYISNTICPDISLYDICEDLYTNSN